MFDQLSSKFSSIFSRFSGGARITEQSLEATLIKIRDALLEADVPYEVIETFTQDVKQEVVGQKLIASMKPSELLIKIVHDKMVAFLGGAATSGFSFQFPATIMVLGLQGSGKTTTIGKLALMLKEQAQSRGKSRRIMVASVDYYRPAALDQLEILAQQAGVLFYRSSAPDVIAAAHDIKNHAMKELVDILLLDTAGRLHVDSTLLDELKKVDALCAPQYKLLVLDAMIGQESLSVARSFDQSVGFMGAILTKMDSDTRGGVAFAFRYALQKPILFAALGEKLEDIQPFRPERMASRIMGMGDIQTLLEQAEKKIKQHDQERLSKSMSDGSFTLDDFASTLSMMNSIGSLGSIAQYLPGNLGLSVSSEQMAQAEQEMKKFKAIMSSMTFKERMIPSLLDGSRKKRIAQGAGVTPADINVLLARFEQIKQYAKLMKKMGKKGL